MSRCLRLNFPGPNPKQQVPTAAAWRGKPLPRSRPTADGQARGGTGGQGGAVVVRDKNGAIEAELGHGVLERMDGAAGESQDGRIKDRGVFALEKSNVGHVFGNNYVGVGANAASDGRGGLFLPVDHVDGVKNADNGDAFNAFISDFPARGRHLGLVQLRD
ncbi:hypothetical protein PpBr36_06888 [Pyricularia pennisetigena]|uniref:hypothetical protein n=1 Tax=Pyricularia pennisetigena TaxID=1578925 RepID=UPI0011524A9C|nr:hypothetical protein PpBr36_06888 [Pyricularia pennisetigena]TLS26072.1 hypothetical protein PpBr36_06888 [Pyricularia pennisetigena]